MITHPYLVPAWHRGASAAAIIALMLCLPHPASATTPTETIRDSFVQANRVLHEPAMDGQPMERLNAISRIVHRIFNSREAGQRSLGREWQARTLAEQEEFVRLFADVIERSFIMKVAAIVRATGDVRIGYRGETVDRSLATVLTTIVGRDGREIRVEYRMTRRGDRWTVHDMVIDGVSLVANYRAQFHAVIQRTSYAFLVGRMRVRPSVVPAALAPVALDADGGAAWPKAGMRW
jgi:phospholipid transport system substrate-binding protein